MLTGAVPTTHAQTPPPELTIVRTASSSVQIRWPNSAAGFVPEQTGALSSASTWSPVPQAPVPEGNELVLSLAPAQAAQYFRLRFTGLGPNQAPVLTPIADATVTLGQTLVLQLSATDPDGDAVRFSVLPFPAPAGATLDGRTGEFTFRPGSESDTHSLTFVVTDGLAFDAQTVTLSVRGPEPGGQTSIRGRVLDANEFTAGGQELPVAGVVVSLLGPGVTTTSDGNGGFLLSGIPGGMQVLDLDTASAAVAPDGSPYAGFREEIHLIEGVENVITRPFYLPRVDRSSLVTIDPTRPTTVINTNLGIVMVVPPDTAKLQGTNFTGQMSISLVPDALAPAALPVELQPGMLITIQPVGVNFATPVPITFPNIDRLPPGTETDLWSLDAGIGRFVVVGTGRVTADGQQIETISGGIRSTDWHAPMPPPPPGLPPDDEDPPNDDEDDDCEENSGSLVTLKTGNLRTDFSIPPWVSFGQSRSLRFVYETRRAVPQPVIPMDLTIPIRSAVPSRLSHELIVGGVSQGAAFPVDTGGLDEDKDESLRLAATFDATALPTGAHPYLLRATSHYFASSIGAAFPGRVTVVNQRGSAFGSGWSLDGLQQLHLHSDGSVLLTDGDGDALFYDRASRRDLIVQDSATGRGTGILRYHATTGRRLGYFVQPGAGGLTNAHNPIFGPDGQLYIISESRRVLRFNGLTGEFLDVFVEANPRQTGIAQMAFGPDGNLYTDLGGSNLRQVLRYSGVDGSYLGVAAEGNGIQRVCGIAFGADGLLYLGDQDPFRFTSYDRILRFDGATGEFIDVFAPSGNLDDTCPFEFGADGHLYIADQSPRDIRRFNGTNGVYMGVFATVAPGVVPFYARSGPDGLLYVGAGPVSGGGPGSILRYRDTGTNGVFVDTFVSGDTGFFNFLPDRPADSEQRFESPAGDTAMLVRNADQTFTRRLKNGTRFHFNARGFLTSVVDRNNASLRYLYDAADRVAEWVDPAGLRTVFTYAGDHLAVVTDPAGRATRFEHDALGRLARVILPDLSARTFQYDERGLMTAETDPLGRTTLRTYDALGRFVRSTFADGSTRRSSNSQSTGVVLPSNAALAGVGAAPVVRPEDAVSTFTDGSGLTTRFLTDHLGGLRQLTDPAGLITTVQSDAAGNLTNSILPDGRRYEGRFESQGNLVSLTEQVTGVVHTHAYEPVFGRITATSESPGLSTTLTHDDRGNLTRIASPLQRITRLTYETNGLISSIEEPDGTFHSYAYDVRGAVIEWNLRSGTNERRALIQRSAAGHATNVVNALGQATALQYDVAGRLTGRTTADGARTTYAYDLQGNPVSLTPPGRPAHRLAFTAFDRMAEYDPPGVAPGVDRTVFRYNGAQALTNILFPDGKQIEFLHNSVGQPIRTRTDRGEIAYSYDPSTGNLVAITAPDGGTLTFGYLGDWVATTTWSGTIAGVIRRTFSPVGRLASLAVNQGAPIPHVYDADGLLTQVGDLHLTRDARSGRITATTLGVVTQEWSYNAFAEPAGFSVSVGGTALLSSAYSRDALGRITNLVETVAGSSSTNAYQYDVAGQLTGTTRSGAVIATFAYDANQNRIAGPGLATLSEYDAQDRLVASGPSRFEYTATGFLATSTTDGAMQTYDYDALGNLVAVTLGNGTRIEYLIDGAGRRIGKRVNGTLIRGFLFQSSLRPAAELRPDGSVKSTFWYGEAPNVPDAMTQDGRIYAMVKDHLGSVRWVVDAASGAVAQRIDYDVFGRVVQDTNPGFQPFGFAGGLYDSDTGLVRFGVRDYDPRQGRWTSKEPLLTTAFDANLYAYVGNDPVNHIDVTGGWRTKAAEWLVKEAANAGVDYGQLSLQGQLDFINNVTLPAASGELTRLINKYPPSGTRLKKGQKPRTKAIQDKIDAQQKRVDELMAEASRLKWLIPAYQAQEALLDPLGTALEAGQNALQSGLDAARNGFESGLGLR